MGANEAHRPEQRRGQRVAIEGPVEVTSPDHVHNVPGVSKDISLGGMFIETASPPAFGATVKVGFTLPGRRTALLVTGTVRWRSKSGMGVQFGLLGARETHAIIEIVRALAS